MKSQMPLSRFFILIMGTLAQPCHSMSQSPSSPLVSSSPKMLCLYDTLTNSRLLYEQLKKTPSIIEECIQIVHPSLIKDWKVPQTCSVWDPTLIPFSPTTTQGCYMEFCDEIPRALITPWGRQPFFNGQTYTPFIRNMIPLLLQKITIASQPDSTDATSYWKTKQYISQEHKDILLKDNPTFTHPTTLFAVLTFNNVKLETPKLRDGGDFKNAAKNWAYVVECDKKEHARKEHEKREQEKKEQEKRDKETEEAALREINMIVEEGNSSPNNAVSTTHFIPIKNKRKD